MQRIFAALGIALNQLRMANVVRATGEQETFQRVIDARVAIIRNSPAWCDIDSLDNAGTDVQNRRFIKMNNWRFTELNVSHTASHWKLNYILP
jgi:hypothetical protein